MLRSLRGWLERRRALRAEPVNGGLNEALAERGELLRDKDRVLASFREAERALERRAGTKGHRPERRAKGA